ncbi:single-stranded DNA-binding protein [Anaerolineales bacterium]
MAGYEYTVIVGNVGRDPEMRYLPDGGTAVCSFSVAVTTRWNDKASGETREKTNWYKVTAWGRQAEVCNQYVRKGNQILCVGGVTASAYLGQDGQPRASLDMRLQNFQFLGRVGDGETDSSASYSDDDSYDGGGGRNNAPSNEDDIPF